MEFTEKRFWVVGCVVTAVVFFPVLLSFISLNRFPPVNSDETGNAAMACEYNRSGRVAYTLMEGVIDPSFEDFSAAGQEGLRGSYMILLGNFIRAVGHDFIRSRFLTFFSWIGLGLLLSFFVSRFFAVPTGILATFLFYCAPDAVLSGHLIRPDVFIGIITVIVCWVAFSDGVAFWPSVAVGFLAGISFGLHPHGLILIPLMVFPCLGKISHKPSKKKYGLGAGLGFATSMVLFLFTIDIETYALGRYSYVTELYRQNSIMWMERLLPWNLIADSILLVAKPGSFYLPEAFQHPHLWSLSGMAAFLVLAFSWVWIFFDERKRKADRYFLAASALLFFGLGFGHMRRELIYTLPLTLFSVSLASTVLTRSLSQIRKSVEAGTWPRRHLFITIVFLLLIAIVSCIFWIFHLSVLFLILLLLVSLAVDKRKDASILTIGAIGLFFLLSLWVRTKDLMQSWDQETWKRLSSTSTLFPGIILLMGTAALYIIVRRFSSQRELFRHVASPLFKTAILVSAFFFIGWSSVHHMMDSLSRAPLADTFGQVDSLTGGAKGKVLGPHYFWFRYGDSFRDIEALVLDYLYSGQKRAAACIRRAHPEIVIVDEGIRRRFQVGQDPKTKQYFFIPFDRVAGVQSVYLGSVPESAHHSRLDVYRLLWPSGT